MPNVSYVPFHSLAISNQSLFPFPPKLNHTARLSLQLYHLHLSPYIFGVSLSQTESPLIHGVTDNLFRRSNTIVEKGLHD